MSFLQKFLAEVFETAGSKVATVAVAEPTETANRPEKAIELQTAGALQSNVNGRKHGNSKANAAQATPAQQATNDAERLAAWERGELVTIPHIAEALEINNALQLEGRAEQIDKPEFVEELSRAIVTIDHISQEQRPNDFDSALSVLRSRVEDARQMAGKGQRLPVVGELARLQSPRANQINSDAAKK